MQYRGPLDVVKQVMRSEGGAVGLYRGLGPTLLREVPGSAAMFAAYEAFKISLAKQQVVQKSDDAKLGSNQVACIAAHL